jgi:hypothetical protein
MKLSNDEYIRRVIEAVNSGDADESINKDGEIVIYTGMYHWLKDGEIHDEPED